MNDHILAHSLNSLKLHRQRLQQFEAAERERELRGFGDPGIRADDGDAAGRRAIIDGAAAQEQPAVTAGGCGLGLVAKLLRGQQQRQRRSRGSCCRRESEE